MTTNPKVTAATLAAAITTILAYILTLAGLAVPDYVQGAITTVLVFTAGWLMPAPEQTPLTPEQGATDPGQPKG